jgi:hypothetical protein
VVSTIGCVVLATFVALSVSDLTSLSDSVVAAGRALDQTAESLRRLEDVPLVGGDLGELADRADEAATSAAQSGRSSHAAIERLAVLLGVAIALVPTVPVVALHLALRHERRESGR